MAKDNFKCVLGMICLPKLLFSLLTLVNQINAVLWRADCFPSPINEIEIVSCFCLVLPCMVPQLTKATQLVKNGTEKGHMNIDFARKIPEIYLWFLPSSEPSRR